MRIAILNWRDLAHPDGGGAEAFVHEIGRRWVANNHAVTLFSSSHPSLPPEDSDGGMKIIRIGRLRTGRHHLRAPRAAVADRPDVILESINTIPYFLPFRRLGALPFLPLVHQMARDVWHAHLPAPAASLARVAEPHLFRPYRRTRVVAVSESTKDDLLNAGVSEVVVVPQGGLGPQAIAPKESEPTVLFVGRLTPNKRPDHAIEAFRRLSSSLPEARLWIVGEGPMKEQLRRNLPPRAELLGRLGRDELLKRMGQAHVLVATSIREGWGLVVTEAAALGTPAVAYDVPGLRDSVRDRVSGLLTDQNPSALAEAVLSVLNDQALHGRLQMEAIAWGSECSWDGTAARVLEHLSATVARPAVSGAL